MTENYGLTAELISLVKKTEGWVPHPYLCPAGWPTIGYGHVIKDLNHPNITLAEGEALLMADLRAARDNAVRLSPVLATEPERRLAAIVDFIFNLGSFAYAGSTLRKIVAVKHWPAAGEQMRRWVYAHDYKTKKMIQLASLKSRREICAKWLEA